MHQPAQFHANEPRVDVTGDPFLFRHIIANLLSNAIKFSPPDTKVEVVLLSRDHEFSITVKDEVPTTCLPQQKSAFLHR
ncbi:MAG: ATP-binding protein [Lewinellaceae bacterium]|nr:ATP-binding protein [Lewinellaceae bacterium]